MLSSSKSLGVGRAFLFRSRVQLAKHVVRYTTDKDQGVNGKQKVAVPNKGADKPLGEKAQDLVALVSDFDPARFKGEELISELSSVEALTKGGAVWVLAQLVALACVIVPPFPVDGLVRVLGALASAGGLFVVVAGSNSLGASLSPLPAPRESNKLVQTGMYQYMRHPLYAGLILFAFGLSIAAESETRLLATGLLTAVLYQKSVVEEAYLVEKHGDAYKKYAADVKRFGLF